LFWEKAGDSTTNRNHVVLSVPAIPPADDPPSTVDCHSVSWDCESIYHLYSHHSIFLYNRTQRKTLLGNENGHEGHTGVSLVKAWRKFTSNEGAENRRKYWGVEDGSTKGFGVGG
jgi:hypothetical protein